MSGKDAQPISREPHVYVWFLFSPMNMKLNAKKGEGKAEFPLHHTFKCTAGKLFYTRHNIAFYITSVTDLG